MFHKIRNIIFRRYAVWNRSFGNYFVRIKKAYKQLKKRIGSDDLSYFYDCFNIDYPKEHSSTLFIIRFVFDLSEIIIDMSYYNLVCLILGDKKKPILKVKLKILNHNQVAELMICTIIGYVFSTTVPKYLHSCRELLLMAIDKISGNSDMVNKHIEKFMGIQHDKFSIIMADHVLNIVNLNKDVIDRILLIRYFDQISVRLCEIRDQILSNLNKIES